MRENDSVFFHNTGMSVNVTVKQLPSSSNINLFSGLSSEHRDLFS